jgi:hypothetical protein
MIMTGLRFGVVWRRRKGMDLTALEMVAEMAGQNGS